MKAKVRQFRCPACAAKGAESIRGGKAVRCKPCGAVSILNLSRLAAAQWANRIVGVVCTVLMVPLLWTQLNPVSAAVVGVVLIPALLYEDRRATRKIL